MNKKELISNWLKEENLAPIHGWDFSHISGKFESEQDLPWNYTEAVKNHLNPELSLLDTDTAAGEFLLSLKHPYNKTSATEFYPPNVKLCREILLPLGIDFRQADASRTLPFEDEKFDLIINRHGAYNPVEIHRTLKNGGFFITEQVGAENDREIVQLLLPDIKDSPFPHQYLNIAVQRFKECGLSIVDAQEAFRPIKFYDIGALVWFAHIIEWEFPGFTVNRCLDNLLKAQNLLERNGVIEGKIHRFFLIAKKES